MNTAYTSDLILLDIASTHEHFEQILQLQKQNLHAAVSEQRLLHQGFVFAEHDMELLKKMAVQLPQIVALCNNRVIGYNLAMTSSMSGELPSLAPMFAEFERCLYRGEPLSSYRFMVGGQVCVDKDFRGRGLLKKLYHETRDRLPSGYQLCVTEISTRNHLSLKVHQQMGFEIASTYYDGKELWNIVVWDMHR